jgi:putative endonuclease
MVFVYILRSLRNNRFYIGSTNNVNKRLVKHNQRLVRSTRNFRPYKIELSQEYDTLTQAKQIEYKIKRLKRKDYISKMIKDGYIKMGL